MADEIRIKVTADTKTAQKDLEAVGKKVEETEGKTDKAKSKWEQVGQKLSSVSPTFKKMSDKWSESSSQIDASFGKSSAAAGLFKLGVVGALAAIAVKAAGVAAKFAAETAKMFDPQGYSKAAGQMQSSIKKLKTTIGSFTAPLVNGVMVVISKIADGLSWILEKIRIFRAFVWGIVKTVLQPVIDGIKQVISWIQQGINILSNLLGFGDVFKAPAESAEETADSMGEVVEATSAGLASFDKLNTLDTSNSGDAETAAEISSSIADAEAFGGELVQKLGNFFGNLDLGKIWDGFTSAAGDAWNGVKNAAGSAWQGIKGFGEGCWNGLKSTGETVWNGLTSFAGDAWNGVKNAATTVWSGIQTVATAVWDTITAWATQLWENIQKVATAVWDAICGVATAVWDTINGAATAIWDAILAVAKAVWEGIKAWALFQWKLITTPILTLWDAFKTAGEAVWGALEAVGKTFNEKVIDPIKNAVKWCMEKIEWVLDKINGVKDFFGGIGEGVGNAVGGVVGGVKSFLGLASGGAVAPNSPAPFILGDNSREYEVVSPVSLMEKAVMSAIAKSGGMGSSQPVELIINLDGRKLARAIYDPLETEGRRRGSSI